MAEQARLVSKRYHAHLLLRLNPAIGGQLGLGDDNDYWKPTRVKHLANDYEIHSNESPEGGNWRAIDISCGLNHTAAIVEIVLDS